MFRLMLLVTAVDVIRSDTIRKSMQPKLLNSKDKSNDFNQPIIDVLKHHGHSLEDVYDGNLFHIAKEFTGFDQTKISDAFHYSADLNHYILQHSFLEVIWCFKLYKEMTFYKTFEKISAMEPSNQFTIYSATGSKRWPSGKDLRHTVCDTISKQPITSGLYEHFLVPARCKALNIKVEDFRGVKDFFGIEQLATRLEFAQALNIELIEKRIRPKIIDSMLKKLKSISFESLSLRAKGRNGKKPEKHNSIFKLISESYRVSQRSLAAVLRFYTHNPRKITMFNEASFKSIAHFIKEPKPANTSFGEIFEKLSAAMADLETAMKTPLILALDNNHIQHSIVNKTLLNIMIITTKEPGDIITSYYDMPHEIRKFVETTRMSKFHILISQSKIRLEHLSIDFFVSLLNRQTVESLKNGKLRHDEAEINTAFMNSVKKIINQSNLIDFQRIYHKSWSIERLKEETLLKLAIHQGLTGNEFLQAYEMEGRNISEVTIFANYTFGMLKTYHRRDIMAYTLKELGNLMKNEINQIINTSPTPSVSQSTPTFPVVMTTKITTQPMAPDVEASAINKGTGPSPAVVIVPALICAFGSIGALAAWIYHAKKKEQQSAW